MDNKNTDVIDDVNDSSKGVSGAETNIIPKKINRAIKNGWQAGIGSSIQYVDYGVRSLLLMRGYDG